MDELIGKTISHYRIVDEVGQGGMGVVFKAEDIRLKRTVALKFLPPELSLDPEAKNRFIQEAQAASALQHNNICTVHDVDETADGRVFIVMDLYSGETLKQKIEKGPLPSEQAIDFAVQIGLGLAKAHERGIVHRDIKPANVLITDDGTAKILDFGLAKLGAGVMLTKAGTTLGTVAYMSPEQTRGDEVDTRTDIWSLGVVLYQMLSGRLPFRADHEQAVIYSIQNADPPMGPSSNIPADCQPILTKALQKRLDMRFQSANELVAELRALQGGSTSLGTTATRSTPSVKKKTFILAGAAAGVVLLLVGGILFFRRGPETAGNGSPGAQHLPRLAVLPFSNLRSDPQTDFLGFALADQIIGNLTYVKTLIVRPSSAIRRYQNEPLDLATAGKTLNVDLLLAGNYLKEMNTIRLSFELVDIRTNAILWREALQEEYENTFKLEDTVARKVVDGLRMQFSADELHEMRADVPRNSLAYDYYLRGISYPVTLEDNKRAVSMLHQSIALDSAYAPAFNELGYRLHQIASYASEEGPLAQEAETAFLKALSLNDHLASAYGNLSTLYTDLGKTEKAFEITRRLLHISPNSPDAHFALGYILRYVGFLNRSEQEMELALSLDPNNPRFRSLGLTYFYLGKYQKAIHALDVDSASSFSLAWKALIYYRTNEPDLARACTRRVFEMEHESAFSEFCQETEALFEKKFDRLRALILRRSAMSNIDGEAWYNLSNMGALLGDPAIVTANLRKAIEGGFFNYPLMKADPVFESVRGKPEFERTVALARTKYEAFKSRYPELQEEK